MKSEIRKMNWSKVLAAFALACLIFILGVYLGTLITQEKVSEITNLEQETRLELESLSLEERLLEDYPCKDPEFLTGKLNELGTKLTYLESQYDKNDPRILELKKPYTLLEIRHYLALKNMAEKCDYNSTLVLFFYSNSNEKIDESAKQGFVLEYLRKKYENVKIYSFDADLDMDIIRTLKDINEITILPSTVIDGKVYAGFHDKDELEKIVQSE